MTALHMAVVMGNVDAIRMLLKLGFDIGLKSGKDREQTAIELAFSSETYNESQQVFLAECVNSVLSQNSERFRAFVANGLPPSARFAGETLSSYCKKIGDTDHFHFPEEKIDQRKETELTFEESIEREISDCRSFILDLINERARLERVLQQRGTSNVARMLRAAQEDVQAAHAVFEENEILSKSYVDRVRDLLRENSSLQEKLNLFRESLNHTRQRFKVGEKVVYSLEDGEGEMNATIVDIRKEGFV
eukprot:CAMPEP_0171464448 /NCGR_PEP_ID=MMETSP0945-20130129/7766_1 /TAXON_ID=109269 /ORGANISM="Vaucheria litorea, Strain CCMP2940" /LENGTH=247 /DNA_ID=CAMNT_0011991545 /DNA_START=71 /DNA_END=811 /DNA_ORIENTATION=+